MRASVYSEQGPSKPSAAIQFVTLESTTVLMAEAMKHAIVAGRMAYLAGRMPKKLYASASSPLDGLIK